MIFLIKSKKVIIAIIKNLLINLKNNILKLNLLRINNGIIPILKSDEDSQIYYFTSNVAESLIELLKVSINLPKETFIIFKFVLIK